MIRGKCHRFSDLCFVKVRQWEVGGGGECVWRGVPAISENSPRGGPQGAALRNKNSMCGTRCVCVCQCVLSLRPSPEKRSSQFEQRCRMAPVFNDKNAVITMTNNGSVSASELKRLKLKTSVYAWMPPLPWSYYIYASETPTPSLILPLISVPPFFFFISARTRSHAGVTDSQ